MNEREREYEELIAAARAGDAAAIDKITHCPDNWNCTYRQYWRKFDLNHDDPDLWDQSWVECHKTVMAIMKSGKWDPRQHRKLVIGVILCWMRDHSASDCSVWYNSRNEAIRYADDLLRELPELDIRNPART